MGDAADFLRHVRVAVDAAEQAKSSGDGEAEVARCCDVLQLLQDADVTAELLASSKAGKTVRKLMAHDNARIKAAAALVVNTWKAHISKQLAAKASAPAQRDTAAAPPPVAAPPQPSAAPPRDEALKRQSSDVPADRRPRGPFAKPKPTGDATRDSIRKGLAAALLQAVADEFEDVESPYALAAAVEAALLEKFGSADAAYKTKARTLLFNLKDKNNPDLRRRVLLGEVSAAALLAMSSEELASDARRSENDKIRAHMKRETERSQQEAACVTDMFRCGKCGKRKCTYYQMQTRSADEPMTTFVRCLLCSHRWKFC